MIAHGTKWAALAALVALSGCHTSRMPGGSAEGTIRAGQTVSGTLAASDLVLGDGSFYDLYTYEGRSGEQIVVTMRSSAFDAFLGGGADAEGGDSDDDSGGGTDAMMTATVGPTGRYVIRANSLEAAQTGAYTLEVRRASN